MVESNLFDNEHILNYDDAKNIISNFIEMNLPNFKLDEEEIYSMFFLLAFKSDNIKILFISDRGDLSYKLQIDELIIDLHKFEPLLMNIEWLSRKNVLFLLKTIKCYIESKNIK